jgi:hypothetical protein
MLKKQKRILAGVKTALRSGFGRQVIGGETNFILKSFFASNLILYLYDRFFQANNKNKANTGVKHGKTTKIVTATASTRGCSRFLRPKRNG